MKINKDEQDLKKEEAYLVNQFIKLEKNIESLNKKVEELENKINTENKVKKEKKKPKKIIGEIAFYAFLALIIFAAFLLKSNNGGRPTSFAGYSMFTVLTSSMESEIPKGSLVITKNISPEDLNIGDDITYMANSTTTITHRIIGIIEKYQNTGKRAFQTKGVMNERPDKNLVQASNIVGKVVYHSEILGNIAQYLNENWAFIIFIIVVIFFFGSVLKKILNKEENNKKIKEGGKKWIRKK